MLVALLAASDASVALMSDGCSAGFVELVGAELSAAGFTITANAVQSPGEVARVRLTCTEGVVEVNLDDHVTDKRVERRVEHGTDSRADSRTAVQVVELLHASLAETRFRSREPVPDQVEAFLAAKEPQPPRAWWVGLLGGAFIAPGGFGTQPSVSGLLADQVGPVELLALLGATVHATTVHGLGGSAEAGIFDVRAAAGLPLSLGRFTIHPHVGAGVILVWAAGRADAGWVAQAGVTGAFAPSIGAAVEFRVLRGLAVVCAVEGVFAPAPIALKFGDGTGPQIGLPLVTVSLGVAAR